MTDSIISVQDNEIVHIILNRPAFFNAFDFEMMDSMARQVMDLAADENVRGVVISGEGKAFCAGGDLKWVTDFEKGPAAAFHILAAAYHQMVLEIRRMNKPVIAAVNGIAAGGGFSLALACDFRVMAESAILRQAYTSNGLCIDGGGTFSLPRLVGLARAMEIVAMDLPITSEKALAWGLVNRVVKEGTAAEEALKMAHELSSVSLHSFGLSKQLLTDSFNCTFESQIEKERQGICSCADHTDGQEGLKAFREKRKPVYYRRT
ncbi:MAG: enoyl-CoA hydratase/isomerase family protein [Dehalococcoidia bacterium]|nr:enoyl-CoA hydratase/isomerase family protein [Dehalococcoidia bacterium]